MGYPTQKHIKQFVQGKTIDRMETNNEGSMITLHFTDGESLRLRTFAQIPQRPGIETIATPYGSDGVVVQSTEIMKTDKTEGVNNGTL